MNEIMLLTKKVFIHIRKWRAENTTLSEQFQHPIEKPQKKVNSIPLTHIYMTAHFPGLINALQYNMAVLKYGPNLPS